MKLIFLTVACLAGLSSFAQIKFEEGYFINDAGEKTDCLIKNVDWKNNPREFTYKTSENSPAKKAHIANVQEFGIFNFSKYVKAEVDIDRHSDKTEELTYKKAPEMSRELLFLKVLVEGDASLFVYQEKDLRRFFYQAGDKPIQPLIYKRYKDPDSRDLLVNNKYQRQLYVDVNCESFSRRTFENLKYYQNYLEKHFVRYHKCNNYNYVYYKKQFPKNSFDLRITPGIEQISLFIDGGFSTRYDIQMPTKFRFRLGTEIVYVLPFNNNKWELILEPTYQSYQSKGRIKKGFTN